MRCGRFNMRNERLGFLGALVLTATAVGMACGGNSTNSTGSTGSSGSSGTGKGGSSGTTGSGVGGASGTGGSSGDMTCSNVAACGGDVAGTWTVKSSCLKIQGDLDISLLAVNCPTVPATGSLSTSGTFVANPDGTYEDHTRTTGSATFPVAESCLKI